MMQKTLPEIVEGAWDDGWKAGLEAAAVFIERRGAARYADEIRALVRDVFDAENKEVCCETQVGSGQEGVADAAANGAQSRY
jgi:hypothetical protein